MTFLSVAEILRIFCRIPEIVIDKHSRLAGQFKALSALIAGDQIIESNHKRSGFGEFSTILFADSARQFFFFRQTFHRTGASNSPRQLGHTSFTLRVSSFSV